MSFLQVVMTICAYRIIETIVGKVLDRCEGD